MTPLSWLLLAVVALLLSALFSGAEIAFVTSDRVVMGVDVSKGGLTGRIMSLFYSKPDVFIATILVGNNIVLVVYGMAAAWLIEEWWLKPYVSSQAIMLALSTVLSTLVILLCGEFFPKSVFRINPNASLKLLAVPLMLAWLLLWPVAMFSSAVSRGLMRLAGIKDTPARLGILSIGDLNSYLERTIDDVTAPAADEVEAEVKMLHNALDFKETQLRDCMIPRNEIVAVDIDDTTRDELSRLFTDTGRSKIVVYSGDIDNVRGYIHVSELFDWHADWKERIKPVLYAPETLLADKMMRRLLTEKRSMAIVVDEFGGTGGLVTLEDLVEEIFGDIEDEHDGASALVAEEIEPGVYRFSGRTEVRTLRDTYRLDIPEDDDYQTLAGYLLHTTGELPAKDQELTIGAYTFTVEERTATRLDLIRIAPAPAAPQA